MTLRSTHTLADHLIDNFCPKGVSSKIFLLKREKLKTNFVTEGMKPLTLQKKTNQKMKSESAPQVLDDTLPHESAMSQNGQQSDGLAGKSSVAGDHTQGSSENPDSSNFDLTAYDLKAHTLLCAELLNGEGIDRLPEETDADLASRLWASWNDCKFSSPN